MYRIRVIFIIIISLLMVQASACGGSGDEETVINPNSIKVEYPGGMTINNGSTFEVILNNGTIHCIEFPIEESIPVYVFVGNDAVRVKNKMAYANTSIKMSPAITYAARKRFGVAPYLEPHQELFNQPVFSAYILLEGHVCDDAGITVTKKVPFFIQYYTDY
jgi:hypothetical protein